jgi:hypothetical protein
MLEYVRLYKAIYTDAADIGIASQTTNRRLLQKASTNNESEQKLQQKPRTLDRFRAGFDALGGTNK